ncbi:YciI family protein [Chelativorans sp. AA-79]|uniref:YciI family protein n=1 Tax=Chelativorans sp. AA-79 TaxID=3028735 RepID=UPI0023F6CAE1|nr:YciI family protein [Chelativorans sp. AA-79]WEX11238.1 YciI family protein [Chelativorans sp. AA-79]
MRYICLVYADEAALRALPKEDFDRLVQDSIDYDDLLERQGHLIVAHALESPSLATNVVTRSGKTVTTDGPFSESKEQLLGFLLVEARDREEAIALASRVPPGAYGRIEVRAAGKPGDH